MLSLLVGAMITMTGFSQGNTIEVKPMNYTDLSTVQQFNKLELGVRLPENVSVQITNFLLQNRSFPANRINPFLQWELDVEAVFVHEATGTVKKIPGFYYREYARDFQNNTWKDVGTEFHMRVRFAPLLRGKWTCTVQWSVKGIKQPASGAFEFNVVQSSNKGFIGVHPNKRNFQLDGEIIYPVGTNFPCPMIGVNNYHMGEKGNNFEWNETHEVTKLAQWMDYHRQIERYAAMGGRFIRTLQTGWATLLEFEKKGNYYDRQHYAWEQDRLLEFCEKNGVYIHFNMMEQEPFMNYGNYDMFDWDWSHYRRDKSYDQTDVYPAYCYADGKRKEPHQSMLLDDDMRFHEQRTRYYIARYGYSTSILMFELLSEPWHVDQHDDVEPFATDTEYGETVRKAVRNYHERLATYIKDSLGCREHLVGIDIYIARFYEGEKYIDQSIYHPNIDVISFNPYSPVADKLLIAKSGDNNIVLDNENSMARVVLTLSEKAGKPVMIAEGGAGDMVDECSQYAQQNTDMMCFGFTGLAGYNSWIGWHSGHKDTWGSMIQAQQFMNSAILHQVFNGKWTQGRQAERNKSRDEKKGKELQYYISADGKTVAGYVKNRSYNFYTKGSGGRCAEGVPMSPLNVLTDMHWNDGGRYLYVDGLEKGQSMEITWYDFKTGKKLYSECVQPGRKGRLRLRFPELSVTEGKPERPVVWFTVVRKDCQ